MSSSILYMSGGGSGSGSSTLATLTDVNITSIADKQFLRYDSGTSKWLNTLLIAADIPNHSAALITLGTLALARGGTNADLSASGSATAVLAQDASHVITARALVAADIPNHDASKITTGAIALARGGTNVDLSASGSSVMFLAQDASHVISARIIAQTDFPVVASTGSPAIQLPFTNFVPSAAESPTTFGAANTQQACQFIMSETMTLGHVSLNIGTGVAGALMGIAIYDAAGTTRILHADGFSVDTSHTGVQRIAFASPTSATLYQGTTYWLVWTATTNTTLTTLNYLMSANWQSLYNLGGIIRTGNSGTATVNGVTNSTIGTLSNPGSGVRIPVLFFD